jgi:hypothetical protein
MLSPKIRAQRDDPVAVPLYASWLRANVQHDCVHQSRQLVVQSRVALASKKGSGGVGVHGSIQYLVMWRRCSKTGARACSTASAWQCSLSVRQQQPQSQHHNKNNNNNNNNNRSANKTATDNQTSAANIGQEHQRC